MLYLTLQSKAYIQHSPKLNKALSAHPTTSTNTYVSKAKCVKKDEKIWVMHQHHETVVAVNVVDFLSTSTSTQDRDTSLCTYLCFGYSRFVYHRNVYDQIISERASNDLLHIYFIFFLVPAIIVSFCRWFEYELTWYIPDNPRSYTHSMLWNDEKIYCNFERPNPWRMQQNVGGCKST